jgi:hypothetical protein
MVNADCIEGKLGHGILRRINEFRFYSTENKRGINITERERDDKQINSTSQFLSFLLFPK